MNDDSDGGFTLLEMVCVIAVIAMLAAVLLPYVPRQTSRARLQAYALQTATLLPDGPDPPDSRGRSFRCCAAPDLPSPGRPLGHQLLRRRHVVRWHHCPD